MKQESSEKKGGKRLLILSLPVPKYVQVCWTEQLSQHTLNPLGIQFHSLQHGARAPSRTDLHGKLNGWSPYSHFALLPLELAAAEQFDSPHMCHQGCIFPIAITGVTECWGWFTDLLWFVQSLQIADFSADRWAGLLHITRCFMSVKVQAPDKFLVPGSSTAQCGGIAEQWVSERLLNIRQKRELCTSLMHWN